MLQIFHVSLLLIAAKYEIMNIVDFFNQHLSYILEGKIYPMEVTERDNMVQNPLLASDNRGHDLVLPKKKESSPCLVDG